MIRQRFDLPRYGWRCYAYYVVTHPNADEILAMLDRIGCDGDSLERAYHNLTSGKCDTGLTYSNSRSRETVMVFAKTSNAKQFQQSYQHETGHAKDHVALAFGEGDTLLRRGRVRDRGADPQLYARERCLLQLRRRRLDTRGADEDRNGKIRRPRTGEKRGRADVCAPRDRAVHRARSAYKAP